MPPQIILRNVAIRTELDKKISAAFETYRHSPDPSLSRWFSRTPELLHDETLDWKHRWLEMISASPATPD